jgi:hypothetical protein
LPSNRAMYRTGLLFVIFVLTLGAECQSRPNKAKPKAKATATQQPASRSNTFVQDVVNSAIALPVGDQQDRLRVLNSAIGVIATRDRKRAAALAEEAIRIESELIATGQEPAVSVLASGFGDCKAATEFVERVYPQNLAPAEQSVIGALTRCPKQTVALVQNRIDTAMERGQAPPRLTMAAIDAAGVASPWSREKFNQLFTSLPRDTKKALAEAPNYAAMYNELAPKVEKDSARDAGLKLLEWFGKLEEGPERSLATKITLGAMKEALGEEGAQTALERNVMARQAAENPGELGDIQHEEFEAASAEDASRGIGKDQTEALKDLPSSLRARQAAANGFHEGTSGDKAAASRYFDMAFSAVDEVWSKRSESKGDKRAAEVVEEVAEAAAHVDAIAALKRAQALGEPAAQAIGMIAVARVVASNADVPGEAPPPRPQ